MKVPPTSAAKPDPGLLLNRSEPISLDIEFGNAYACIGTTREIPMRKYDMTLNPHRSLLSKLEGAGTAERVIGADEKNYSPQVGMGVAVPLQQDGRDDLIDALRSQVEDLKSRLNQSETERREILEICRVEREKTNHILENVINAKLKI